MTPEQVKLVQLSFIQMIPNQAEAGAAFYRRLFQIAPDLRPMFKDDINAQSQKLMDMLALAIGALRSPGSLTAMLKGLGQRHIQYGVRDEHFAKVGEALLWMLERQLGDAFTPQVKAAWTDLYGAVTKMMQASAPDAAKVA